MSSYDVNRFPDKWNLWRLCQKYEEMEYEDDTNIQLFSRLHGKLTKKCTRYNDNFLGIEKSAVF